MVTIVEYSSTLYVGLWLKQNGRPYKAMVRTVSKSWKEALLKLLKVSSLSGIARNFFKGGHKLYRSKYNEKMDAHAYGCNKV